MDIAALPARDLARLVETGRQLTEEVRLPEVLQRILRTATELTDSKDGSVMLFDEKSRSLYFAQATGDAALNVMTRFGEAGEPIRLEGSKAGQVFTTGQSIIVNTLAEDPAHFKGVDRQTGHSTQSMVCVPMSVGGQRIGVVQILNRRRGDYTDRDRVLLEHLAAQAAVAIRNARLFDDVLAHMGLYSSHKPGEGPLELVTQLNAPAHAETLSVLFADMRGFTQLCHLVGRPEVIQQMLNEFLAMLADAVVTHGGAVNKFLGDGLMALFRSDDHARHAVEGANEMLTGFTELRLSWIARSNVDLGFLDLGIGIATDEVILGSVGSARVRDFTAIGTAVNLACLLMENARGGKRLLIDRMTYRGARDVIAECDEPEAFEFRKPGQSVGHPYERYAVRKVKGGAFEVPSADGTRSDSVTVSTPEVFISYSHHDRAWLDALQIHLKPYTRGGTVTVWSDTDIAPGQQWRREIESALARAVVAVLLVSPYFLNSEFIAANELPPLLDAANRRGLAILWVPVTASSYDETDIGKYQSVLDPAHPLDTLTPAEQSQALVAVCKAVKVAAAKALKNNRSNS